MHWLIKCVFQSSKIPNFKAVSSCLPLFLEFQVIPKSYHSLSSSRATTVLIGLHNLANSIKKYMGLHPRKLDFVVHEQQKRWQACTFARRLTAFLLFAYWKISKLEHQRSFKFPAGLCRSQTCNCKKSAYWLKRCVDSQRNIYVEKCFVIGQ